MTTEARVRAARDLHRFLGSEQVTGHHPGAMGATLDMLQAVVPYDCMAVIEWDAPAFRQSAVANRHYPRDVLRFWETYLHLEPVFLAIPAGAPALRTRDIPPRERAGIIHEECIVRPGFADAFSLRLSTGDGRFVGTLNAGMLTGSQPDDLAVDLLDLLAPRLAAALDPVPGWQVLTRDLAEGRAEGLTVPRHGRARPLTPDADLELARPTGPLRPLISAAATGSRPPASALVLVGDRVVSVSVQGGTHGVLVLHRTVPAPFGLSVRELQILDALADGTTNGQLAARFGIAARTVATYIERLLVKTGCPNRTAAARLATRLNLTF